MASRIEQRLDSLQRKLKQQQNKALSFGRQAGQQLADFSHSFSHEYMDGQAEMLLERRKLEELASKQNGLLSALQRINKELVEEKENTSTSTNFQSKRLNLKAQVKEPLLVDPPNRLGFDMSFFRPQSKDFSVQVNIEQARARKSTIFGSKRRIEQLQTQIMQIRQKIRNIDVEDKQIESKRPKIKDRKRMTSFQSKPTEQPPRKPVQKSQHPSRTRCISAHCKKVIRA